jgi:hypothetical protein
MKSIRSDQGTQFTAAICNELHKLIGIEHIKIVPYHPEANGLIERRNTEIMKHLRILVHARRIQEHWSRYLPLVQRIINFTVDSSIGTSPQKVIFGDMITSDMSLEVFQSEDATPTSTYLSELKRAQLELIATSRAHLDKEAQKREDRIITVDPSENNSFHIGEYILLAYPARPPHKLASIYRGPMVIKDKFRDDLFEVLDIISDKSYEVHVSRLRKLHLPEGFSRQDLINISAIDHQEYEIDKIIEHRGNNKKKSTLEFLVSWTGYGPEDNSWEPYRNLKDTLALEKYIVDHPEIRII